MIDFLSSPILFPSDMDSSKLSADPTFKLPAAMNWADHHYDCKPMTGLTELVQLEPINDEELNIFAPIYLDDLLKPISDYDFLPPVDLRDDDSGYGDDDNDIKQKTLRAHLRGALTLVENDMQRNGYDRLYMRDSCQDKSDEWSWREELVDVPDLVHSVCSSSAQSLMDPVPTTPILLESGISSLCDGTLQPIDEPTQPSPHTTIKTKSGKKLMNKIKQVTFAMKQDCVKSVFKTSRKISQWIKN